MDEHGCQSKLRLSIRPADEPDRHDRPLWRALRIILINIARIGVDGCNTICLQYGGGNTVVRYSNTIVPENRIQPV
jgi:hypothetical protein